MGRTRTIAAGLGLVTFLWTGLVGAWAAPSAFGPGEQSTYKVQYLGMTAGTAQITVGAEVQQWGTPVLPIVTLAKSEPVLVFFPIKDKFITYWDPVTQRTQGSDLYADENRKRRRQRIQLKHHEGKALVTKQNEGQAEVQASQPISSGSMDIAAAAFALRNMPLKVGDTVSIPLFTGEKSFQLVATVEKREPIATLWGTKDVIKLRVQTQFSGKFESKNDIRLFLTDDASRVPVRVEAEFLLGTIVAELSDYKPGRTIAPHLVEAKR